MVGTRIKQARLESGLSQQQLAGEELSRSFICRVELGQVTPSLATLQRIADRLGKPLDYFTASETEEEDLITGVQFILKEAEQALQAQDFSYALNLTRKAERLSRKTSRSETRIQAQVTLLQVYDSMGSYSEAIQLGEDLVYQCRALNLSTPLPKIHLYLGSAYFRLGDFAAAKRHYQWVITGASGRKSQMELEARALINLGSCLFRLGELGEAVHAYQTAIELGERGIAFDLQGLAKLGLGWALYKQGMSHMGIQLTREAERILLAENSAGAVYAKHNLAIMEAGGIPSATSLNQLQECLREYRERGYRGMEAAVLEELAEIYRQLGEFHLAQDNCQQALISLDDRDDPLQRGRLHRKAAQIQLALGNHQRAHDLLLLSQEIFRRLHAQEEIATTQELLQSLGQ